MTKTICDLGNHIATYEGTWGVCSSMVCRWIAKVQANQTVNSKTDLGNVGALILQTNQSRKAFNNGGNQVEFLFRKNGLTRNGGIDSFGQDGEFEYSVESIAMGMTHPSLNYLSISWQNGGNRYHHAIGTNSKKNNWLLCDPNFAIWSFDSEQEFRLALIDHLNYLDVDGCQVYEVNTD